MGSAGTKLAVAGVTQAGNNVAYLVEVIIHRGQVDRHVGMGTLHGGDAFRSADQPDEFDAFDAPILQNVHRSNRRPAGREHGVEDEADRHARLGWQLVVILHRFKGFFSSR